MSNAYAIEAVTTALREVIRGAVEGLGTGARVITEPPDEARNEGNEQQVNLFLYQTAIAGSWRNEPFPVGLPGETDFPALPLVLHYLVTPYVRDADELIGHRLLGASMLALHDHPVLSGRELAAVGVPADVSEHIESVRITPLDNSVDEISKMWTAFQTQYRLSAAYEVRVVLLESGRARRTPLPVLRRGEDDRGPAARGDVDLAFPRVDAVVPPTARLGDEITLTGGNLAAAQVRVRLTHPLLADPVLLTPGAALGDEIRADLPATPEDLPAGLWSVSAQLTDGDGLDRLTNEVPLAIAPRITTDPLPTVAREPGGRAVVALAVEPHVHPTQRAHLLLGSVSTRANPFQLTTGDLVFEVPDAPLGTHVTRVRVDGVDSVFIDRSVTPPRFDETQRVTVT
jgi:Pvc16 N-terminal domain